MAIISATIKQGAYSFMENSLTGKFLKSLRLLLEMTQEKMAGEFGMSSSRLRDIEQEKVPISTRLETKIMKRLPTLLISRFGDSVCLDMEHREMGLSDWERILRFVAYVSPESIEERQIPQLADKFVRIFIWDARSDFERKSDETWRNFRRPLCEWLELEKSIPFKEVNEESCNPSTPDVTTIGETMPGGPAGSEFGVSTPDSESEFTSRINAKLLERLYKEAEDRGLTFGELMESIVNYYFESKRVFMKEGNPSNDPVSG
ncbi:MAG: helix-turn-helix transcriptional regulator [Desulfomonile tiedjei]|uniref:Helix-turn-helix transcriptional regulator n=1 Tax=Desulfomonile tiedjei TaxID=2358 RepID=A0A9D6V1N5_9BACT|nr:helix-turn-helix transcriptional regulator [Desulfomonile tiedjei]